MGNLIVEPTVDEIVALMKVDQPLGRFGFSDLVASLRRALIRAVSTPEQRAIDEILDRLDRNWPRLSPAAQRRAIRQAQTAIEGLPGAASAATAPVFTRWANRWVRSTRNAVRRILRLDVPRKLRNLDDRIIRFVGESQTNFITNEYGARIASLGRRARKLVARGLAQGLGRDQISRLLADDAKLVIAGRSRSYYDVVAHQFSNRARTLSQLSTFEDNGIIRYQVKAVLDLRTSNICRFMDGKIFDVDPELRRFGAMQRMRDPEKIRDAAPWVRDTRDRQGRPNLIATVDGQPMQIARVVRSGVGQRGVRGQFTEPLTLRELQRLGIAVPPFHPN